MEVRRIAIANGRDVVASNFVVLWAPLRASYQTSVKSTDLVMQRLAYVAEEVRCGQASVVSSCDRRGGMVGHWPLTDKEQSLLDLDRVRLPTMESHVSQGARPCAPLPRA